MLRRIWYWLRACWDPYRWCRCGGALVPMTVGDFPWASEAPDLARWGAQHGYRCRSCSECWCVA